jgi:regulator of protease activity HflC (stomatin/prohibitin superfamily)
MFDKLIDVLLQFLDLFRGWVIVRAGTVTVIYTLGRPTRVCRADDGWFNTGFHPKFCLGIDQEDDTSVREELWCMASQDLQTKDGKFVRVSGAFNFNIVPEKVVVWQTTLGDENGAVPTAFRSAIAETIVRRDLTDLLEVDEQKGLRQEILDRARKSLNKYGYSISDFKWVERTGAKTYRFITGD